MADRRGHARVSRRVFRALGRPWSTAAFLARHRAIDADPSLLRHREWDHPAERFLAADDPDQVLEWLVHLAVDYRLVQSWADEATAAKRGARDG